MNLQQRKDLLLRLGRYMLANDDTWLAAKERAFAKNGWFIPEFIDRSTSAIATQFLNEQALDQLIERYDLPAQQADPKKVGIVMAGNLPLVGFHDLLCVFLSGHIATVKLSSKDEELMRHLIGKLAEWEPESSQWIQVSEMLKSCDAYIATGSNNSSRYFEYYFRNLPHIIRRNRSSAAVLDGTETHEELEALSDDVYLYFGLGCRNVSKLFVPNGYDFVPLLNAFRKWNHLINHHKYKNNYDYNLAVQILNNKFYMSNESILLVEEKGLFSPISQVNYEFYEPGQNAFPSGAGIDDLQCLVGHGNTAFGSGQTPGICDYADGVDTMAFLSGL